MSILKVKLTNNKPQNYSKIFFKKQKNMYPEFISFKYIKEILKEDSFWIMELCQFLIEMTAMTIILNLISTFP